MVGKTLRLAGAFALLMAAAVVATSTAEPVSAAEPAVWIGSPIDGRWTDSKNCPQAYQSDVCSLPQSHHTPYLGTKAWAVDLQASAGKDVKVFVAPKNTELDKRIFVKVESVRNACLSGGYDAGGQRVVVGVYLDKKQLIGKIAYSHIKADPGITDNKWLDNRYGTRVGRVFSKRTDGKDAKSNPCWRGVHHHLEVVSNSGYACYNKGYKADKDPRNSTALSMSNFVGFIGGSYAGPRKACP